MKITEITASLGRTIQIKQFEPLNFHASIKAEVGEGEDLNKAFEEIKKIVKDQVAKEIVIWENPQMVLRRMQQAGADKYVKEDLPF
jgi:hypothetical protein